MDPASSEPRDREPSTRRTRARQKSRASLAELPVSPKNPHKKRKRRKETSSAEYYLVKSIIDEKQVGDDEIEYLIDWEDNPETGESYTPTWEPYDNVRREAIADWERKKSRRQGKPFVGGQQQSSPLDIEPSRPAKRQRLTRPTTSPNQGPRKKPRRAGTAETARFQSVSQETVSSHSRVAEIKDSYEEEEIPSEENPNILVGVLMPRVDDTFDRDAYAKVTALSSQISEASQVSQPSQSSIYTASKTGRENRAPQSRPRPFLWDEPAPIIPDSQELPGSSSYKPSQTSTSQTGAISRSNTGTDPELSAASLQETQWRSSHISENSGDIIYRHSEPPSYPSRTNFLEESLEATSSRSGVSIERSTSEGVKTSNSGDSNRSTQPQRIDNPGHTADGNQPVNYSAEPRSCLSPSKLLVPSPQSSSLAQAPGTLSEEAVQTLEQVQSQQRQQHGVDGDSNLQPQTQTALSSQQKQLVDDHVNPSSGESGREGSQTGVLSQPADESPLRTQQDHSPGSSIETNWQAAQIVSPSPQPSSEVLFTQTPAVVEQPPGSLTGQPREQTSEISSSSTLYQIDPNSVRSYPRSQERSTSQDLSTPSPDPRGSNHLVEDHLENVVVSIERAEEISSSPLPPRPSPPSSSLLDLLDTDQSNSRASITPSNLAMADKTISEPRSIADLLKQARATAAANTMAKQAEARATSASVPLQPPVVNQMLPLRELAPDIPLLTTHPSLSPKSSPEIRSSPKGLQVLPSGQYDYIVPLPINARIRNMYDIEIGNYRHQIHAFLNDDELDFGLINQIDVMLDRLKKFCDHQDLNQADLSTQEIDPVNRQAAWAQDISTKCTFVADFLEALRPFNEHVIIVSRPGRMTDILEALLQHREYIYQRPDRPDSTSDIAHGVMKVSLLSSDLHSSKFELAPASVVVAFDSTFEDTKNLKNLRVNQAIPSGLAPLVRLVVTYSIEHLDLCFDKQLDPLDRRSALVGSILQSQSVVGVLPPGHAEPPAAGKAVAAFVVGTREGVSWPLLPMPEIEGLDLEFEHESNVESASKQALTARTVTQSSYDMSSPVDILSSGAKRSLGNEEHRVSSKRQRLTPVIGEHNSSADPSRISETVQHPSDIDPKLRANKSYENTAITTIQEIYGADQIRSLVKKVKQDQDARTLLHTDSVKVTELQSQLQNKNDAEDELFQQNQKLQARCQDLEKSIGDIQPKYQEALNDRGRFEHEMTESLSRENNLRQRFDARTVELTKVRDEKAVVEFELSAARATLSTSVIPEIAELYKLKEELNSLRVEKERLQKRSASMQNDLEYMRSNYQQASSAAAESRNEINELTSELRIAQRKASENTVRIHEIQASEEIKQYLDRIDELEAEKVELERELEKRSEELKTFLNGRRQTRGTSVPRSPRMGTMSPGARPMARVLSGVGSRGNSPAPTDAPPFRGTFTGDALFTTGPGSGRWGNHLM